MAALAVAAALGTSVAYAQDDEPLNAAGPVGVSSGHATAVKGVTLFVSSALTAGAIVAVLVHDGTGASTSTSGTTATSSTSTSN